MSEATVMEERAARDSVAAGYGTGGKSETEVKSEAAARAQGFFEEGYNCCQSVFLAFAKQYGFDRETACRLSASFGGGVGRLRQICGAVSAMALVCGLETGAVEGADQAAKAYNYENVQQLAAQFEAQSGSLICRELLGLDQEGADKELREKMQGGMGRHQPQARDEQYYATRPCKRLIGLAAEITQKWLTDRSNAGQESKAQTKSNAGQKSEAQPKPNAEE